MKKINIRRIYYHLRHKYFTLNNAVILVAFMIAAGWVWGSLGVMQRNYTLQRELDRSRQELQLAELQVRNLELEGRYYQTEEFQGLAVRQRLGLVSPGESVLILPENSDAARAVDEQGTVASGAQLVEASNFEQWMDFLFGS